jgi:putative adhesin
MRLSAIAAVISLAHSAAGGAHAAEKKVDRTFNVSPGGTLIVDADSASVRVTGSSGNQVVVHMLASASEDALAAMKLEATQSGNDVNVTMRRGQTGWFRSWSGGDQEIVVSVPQRFEIKVKTGGGDVELANTTGSASLNTSGGDIVARNVTGKVESNTSGGSITMDTIRGEVDADTSGGDVHLVRVDGKMRGNTSGGNVEVDLVGANRGIVASTSGGSIRLTLPRGTNANLEATTSGGGFTSDLPVSTTQFREGHVKGTLNGGGPSIDANTSGGDISVRAAN